VMALNYAMALGCEFDCVINLDGYNDIALPRAENVPSGVHPAFPRSWNLIATQVIEQTRLAVIGRSVLARQQRKAWVDGILASPLRWSMTAQLVWKLRDGLFERDITAALTELHRLEQEQASHLPYTLSGPPSGAAELADLNTWLAGLWARCSHQLAWLCE